VTKCELCKRRAPEQVVESCCCGAVTMHPRCFEGYRSEVNSSAEVCSECGALVCGSEDCCSLCNKCMRMFCVDCMNDHECVRVSGS